MMQLTKISHAKGVWVYDQDGNEYLDGSGGPATFCLGHADERVNRAIMAQLELVAQGYRSQFLSDPLERLTEIVTERCGADSGLANMIFVSGGSEAVESCLKIALQYQQAIGQTSRTRFIARERSYHGNTLGALSVSGYAKRRQYFEGSLLPVSFVSAANAYRLPDGVSEAEFPAWAAAELEAEILRVGPETVCAFIFEPVVGAAGCVVPAPAGYAKAVQAVCQKYGVLVICDEVMSGAGRVGPWRASADPDDDIVPDLISVAKGLGGGYIPIGAAVYQDYIAAPIQEKYVQPMTGHTFMGHTTACASAVAVQTIMQEEELTERVTELGPWFGQMLKNAIGDHPYVGDVRGRGFFWGIELVEDKGSKRPFDPSAEMVVKMEKALREAGILAYPVSGFGREQVGDGFILAPAYNATREELEEMVARTQRAVGSITNSK